jgi:hypothetical protein
VSLFLPIAALYGEASSRLCAHTVPQPSSALNTNSVVALSEIAAIVCISHYTDAVRLVGKSHLAVKVTALTTHMRIVQLHSTTVEESCSCIHNSVSSDTLYSNHTVKCRLLVNRATCQW